MNVTAAFSVSAMLLRTITTGKRLLNRDTKYKQTLESIVPNVAFFLHKPVFMRALNLLHFKRAVIKTAFRHECPTSRVSKVQVFVLQPWLKTTQLESKVQISHFHHP